MVPDPVRDKVSLPARLLIDVIAEFETVANPSYIFVPTIVTGLLVTLSECVPPDNV